MNNYDVYIPIDVHGPIKTSANVNIQRYTNNNPLMLFQLFDGSKPLMLDDISKVSIAFTNTNNESVRGSGNLQVVNPHRGTISYELNSNDITMSGIHTITIGVTTNNSFFTVQSTIFCPDMDKSIYDILNKDNNNSNSDSNTSNYTQWEDSFPCKYYNNYCRVCRRCKWAWENNTYPKPLCFNEIKMCKNPYITPPISNFANMSEYEKANYPTMISDNGDLVICIDDTHYTCDIGKNGALYLSDKTIETPDAMIGLYLGPKLIPYYKISEKINDSEFDINTLFD